jgi:RNA polymerase sigma-70 factor (ECF subfamily)
VSLGDQDVAALYRRYFPLLLRKCQRMLGETPSAQDAAQETFTRLWQQRAGLSEPGAVVAWLYTTATRVALDRIRSPRSLVMQAPELPDDRSSPDHIAAARALLQHVSAELTREELELLVLSRLDGLTQREIAELLRSSERTIRRRLAELEDHLQRLGADHA